MREKCEGKGGGSRNGVLFHKSCSRAGFKKLLVYQNSPFWCRFNFFNPTCTKPFLPHGGSRKRDCSRTFPTVIDEKHWICRLGFSIGNHNFLDSNAFLGFRVLIGNWHGPCDMCDNFVPLSELGRKLKVWCLRSLLRTLSGLGLAMVSSHKWLRPTYFLEFQFYSCKCHLKLVSFILSCVLYYLICESPICFEMVCCVVVFDESMIGWLSLTHLLNELY